MSIVSYTGIYTNGTPITVHVLQANSVVSGYPLNMLKFATANDAAQSLGGVFDSRATLFTSRYSTKEFLINAGFPNVEYVSFWTDGRAGISFPNGRNIAFMYYGGNNTFRTVGIAYSFDNATLVAQHKENTNDDIPTSEDFYPHIAMGLISDTPIQYTGISYESGYITSTNTRGLFAPCVSRISETRFALCDTFFLFNPVGIVIGIGDPSNFKSYPSYAYQVDMSKYNNHVSQNEYADNAQQRFIEFSVYQKFLICVCQVQSAELGQKKYRV